VNGGFDTVVYEVLKSFKQCDFSSFPLVLEADSRYSLTIDNKGEDTDQVGKMDSKNYGYLFSEFSKEMNDFCREKNIDLINTKLVRYELEKQEEELDFDKYILKLYLNDYIRDFILIFNAYSFGGDVLVSYKRTIITTIITLLRQRNLADMRLKKNNLFQTSSLMSECQSP